MNETDLEDAFKQVAEKVKASADLLLEANELSNKLGLGDLAEPNIPSKAHVVDDYHLDDFWNFVNDMKRPLLKAMDACGWRTSSLSC